MFEKEFTRLPLKYAYEFGSQKGFNKYINEIRKLVISKDFPYTSSVRRGYIVELFKENNIFEEFINFFWPVGRTIEGERFIKDYLRIKKKFENFSNSPLIAKNKTTARQQKEEIQTHIPEVISDKTLKRLEKGNDHWIATAILESHNPYDNNLRLQELTIITNEIIKKCSGPGIIVFPGGHFKTGKEEPHSIYNWVEKEIKSIINNSNRDLSICFGIDGRILDLNRSPVDQVACAITVDGIVARGRKFAPTKREKGLIQTAHNHLSKEDGLSRILNFHDSKYYLAVCYDTCGISNSTYNNPDCDAILNFVHRFEPAKEGPSGAVQFARKVFSGASKKWGVPVYASVVFFRRSIPEAWPSGVHWNRGSESVSFWKYEYNPITPVYKLTVPLKEGGASIRIFT